MTKPSMRDRLARAICRQQHILLYGTEVWRPGELDAKVDAHWPKHVPAADAVLSELDKPTEAMIEAGMDATDWPICSGEVEHRWQAMIAEAKKP